MDATSNVGDAGFAACPETTATQPRSVKAVRPRMINGLLLEDVRITRHYSKPVSCNPMPGCATKGFRALILARQSEGIN